MIPVFEPREWMERLLCLPGSSGVFAFYDHRLGAVVKGGRCAFMPVDDHLVHRGDGVFEYIRYKNRVVKNLDAHLDRLRQSTDGLAITLPCSWEHMRAVILAVADASEADSGAIRVFVGRGQGGFGIDPAECPVAGLYVVAHEVHEIPESVFETGVSACRSAVPAKPALLARIKSTNYLPNVLMALEATRRGFDFSFAFDDDGFLAEAAIANVALVDTSGTLVMPEFRNALPGTTARKAAALAEPLMPVVWRPVPEEELFNASEVFLLGTAHECLGVVRYEQAVIGEGKPGPVALALRRLLRDAMSREGTEF